MSITATNRLKAFRAVGGNAKAEPNRAEGPVSFAYQFPLRILVAEDDYITRRILMMFLRHYGYEPMSVENGLECTEEALRNTYDLIISDIDMPEMNGMECAELLRQKGVETPIIALSASVLRDPRDECLRAGMDEFLAKPVPPDKLRSILRDAYFGQLRKKNL